LAGPRAAPQTPSADRTVQRVGRVGRPGLRRHQAGRHPSAQISQLWRRLRPSSDRCAWPKPHRRLRPSRWWQSRPGTLAPIALNPLRSLPTWGIIT
jgi:hypothetical protein